MNSKEIYDVVIAGAGPAGCTCALALKDTGLKVALIDKAVFPRDKICGDAISGRAISTLKSLNPEYANAFRTFPKNLSTRRTALFFEKYRSVELYWKIEAYTCSRWNFDNYLLDLVKEHTLTEILEGRAIKKVTKRETDVLLELEGDKSPITAKMIIGCDGAHSVVAKQLTATKMDRAHYGGAVRAYYRNVRLLEDDRTEVYVLKEHLPGYFWVFPIADNLANVGFGILSSYISKEKINLKTVFYEFLKKSPVLAEKFAESEQISKLQGFGLPFASRRVKIAGDRFVLTGDAASLIDPISGDGIGNAMLSASFAAQQVKRCFEADDFSETQTHQYATQLYGRLGKEFKRKASLQKLVTQHPILLDVGAIISRNSLLRKWIQRVI
ncbi:MAG: geranylgeranyl reductase family protein [Bacteroidetes bacterium]|nr:geranylgeranyl reductase family protein [Bacteroidota bacterium]